jgi:hypothetical protein
MHSPDQQHGLEPRLPPPGGHARRALDLLLSGQSFTSLEFQAITGSWKLAARVDQLRHRWGWPVTTTLVPNPERLRAKPIARYSLPAETIARFAPRS